jgi:uncharacterized RDD family membrane protein YckC
MAKIEVPTTQKVFIQYETAGFLWRFIASLIDKSVISLFFLLLGLFILPMFDLESDTAFIIVFVICLLIIAFYTLVIEVVTNGQSIGKKLVGIQVIKLSGEALDMNDYLVRWAYRFVDFTISGFALGSMAVFISEKNQRIGDMIANTTVVRLRHDKPVKLDDLQILPDKQTYVPRFPLVVRYSDEEMLAIKNLLIRHQQFPNDTYRNLIHETSYKLHQQMGLDVTTRDDVQFLKEIISEYVILTR